MRTLVQPEPVSTERIESFRSRCERLEVALAPGLTLAEAIVRPLVAAGLRSAVLQIEGLLLEPLCCVMPGPADGPAHVAYFSAPRAGAGICCIEQANLTFGNGNNEPRLHCHASWVESNGARRGGHILLAESVVARPCVAAAWGFRDLGILAEPDPETNFPLLRPVALNAATPSGNASEIRHPQSSSEAVLARIRPNEDFCTAVETLARRHGLRDAMVRGGLGSLVGACFTDGHVVTDHATEVFVRNGALRDGVAEIEMTVIDMQGLVHVGRLVRGENAVCITFDVVLEVR
jgi:predicted DNA-binding protein with PD1-like motif